MCRPIEDPVDRCQLRTGRGQKCDSKNRPSVRAGGSRDHEHLLACGLKRWSAKRSGPIIKARVSVHAVPVPDNHSKLAAVVTRARIDCPSFFRYPSSL